MSPVRLGVVHDEIETFDEFHGGAIARWTAEITRRAPPGFAVTVITKPARRSPYGQVAARVIPVRSALISRIPRAAPYAVHWHFREVLYHLRRNEFDVIHLHARPQWVHPIREAGIRSPLVLHLQNDHLGIWDAREVEALLDEVDLVLCISDFVRRRAIGTELRVPKPSGTVSGPGTSKFRVLHGGVDTDRFKPIGGVWKPGDPVSVVYLGRLVPDKAPDLTMKSVIDLRREGFAVSMRIIGARDFGPSRPSAYVRELHRIARQDPGAFEFGGYVHHRDLPVALAMSQVYVHACRWNEPFGLATIEAMGCGLLPVVSDRGGNREAVGEAGRVFDPESPTALTDVLRDVLLDPGQIVAGGQRARKRAEDRFSWGSLAEEYFRCLAEIA
jgi:glycosyltransferase involved in cell wall biosynthesis